MNPQELLEKLKELVSSGDLGKAKEFFESNKDSFGDLMEQAQGLLGGAEGAGGILDKVKGIFGK